MREEYMKVQEETAFKKLIRKQQVEFLDIQAQNQITMPPKTQVSQKKNKQNIDEFDIYSIYRREVNE